MPIEILFTPLAYRFAKQTYADRVRKHNPDETLFEHAQEVAEPFRGVSEHDYIVALLHDVIEDCAINDIVLLFMFGHAVRDDVVALTRQDDEPYDNYIERLYCSGSDSAIRVKLTDILCNHRSAPTSLRVRYQRAFRRLSTHPAGADFMLAESA